MTENMFFKKTAPQLLKEEFQKARKELSDQLDMQGFQEIVRKQMPIYDCAEGFERIRRAWYGYYGDLYLTRIITEVKNNLMPAL